VHFSFSTFFSVSCHISRHTVCVSHFPRFCMFLAIFQVKECFCVIFHVSRVSRHNPGSTMCISHSLCFHCFSPFSSFYSVHFSFFTFFRVSSIFQIIQWLCLIFHVFQLFCHNLGPTACIFHFSCFTVFLAIFHVLEYVFLIFRDFQFFPMLAIFQVLQCVFLIFHFFWEFLAIFQFTQCLCFISHIIEISRHIPGPTGFASHFQHFPFFSPYSISYLVHFSFSTYLSVSRHIAGARVCVSHFLDFQFSCHTPVPTFSTFPTVFMSNFSIFLVFLAIYHVLQCVFLILSDFQLSRLTPGPTVCISHFPLSWVFFAVFKVR
jgi:hypothetical protein